MAGEPDDSSIKLLTSRRAAREATIKVLYAMLVGGRSRDEAIRGVLEVEPYGHEVVEFVKGVIQPIQSHQDQIIATIESFLAKGWEFDRLSVTDRCVLVLAVYELYHVPEIPPAATINEAVSIAKKYGDADSGRFVNGLLGKLVQSSPKADWKPGQERDLMEPTDELESDVEPEEELVVEGSAQHEEMIQAGAWSIRADRGDS